MSKIRYVVEFDMPVSNGVMEDEVFNDLKETMIRVEDKGLVHWDMKADKGNTFQILLSWNVLKKELIKDEKG